MDGFHTTLKRVLDGGADVASEEEKELTVRRLIQTGCAAAMLATLQPLPVVDVALIMPIQVGMVQGIGRVRGYRLDKKSVWEILNNVRTGLVTQHATLAAAKLVPAAGTLVAACVAHGLTYAVGVLADSYFQTGRTMLPSVMQATFNRAYLAGFQRMCKSRWDQTCAFFRGRPTAAQRMRAVERERREGRMTDEEAEHALEEILNER
jgi:uncharacterized protein (DUF697 family)